MHFGLNHNFNNGAFVYSYTLINARTAQRPLRWFYLVVAALDNSAAMEHLGVIPPSPPIVPQAAVVEPAHFRDPRKMG